jgi:hypothetical protein
VFPRRNRTLDTVAIGWIDKFWLGDCSIGTPTRDYRRASLAG